MRGCTIFAAMLVGVGVLAASALIGQQPWLIWNASASLPVGFYRVTAPDRVAVDDLVAVAPPEALADYLSTRGYLPRGVPLLKRVTALAGTEVCRVGAVVSVGDRVAGRARLRHSGGRPLPVWSGCRMLRAGEVFLMNRAPDSFDGRYVGPLLASAIVARLMPIWTEENGERGFAGRARDAASPLTLPREGDLP